MGNYRWHRMRLNAVVRAGRHFAGAQRIYFPFAFQCSRPVLADLILLLANSLNIHGIFYFRVSCRLQMRVT